MNISVPHFDLCVIGGGSAGIGAALGGARAGLSVLLVEKGDCLGGNAVRGGVHSWEPGVGGNVFPREIYHRLREIPLATAVWSIGRHLCWPKPGQPKFPGGECLVDPARTYEDTQQRCGTKGYAEEARPRERWHGVVFEPDAYAQVVEEMFRETGNGTLWKQASFQAAEAVNGVLHSVRIEYQGRIQSVTATTFIDATADALVGRSLGCPMMRGVEAADRFQEPGAPAQGDSRKINAISLIFRITPVDSPAIEPLDPATAAASDSGQRFPGAHVVEYPNGDRCLNMLPTMEGREFLDFIESGKGGYARAYEVCERRVRRFWHHLQSHYPEFRAYRLSWLAPALGVRESLRVVGEYILTEPDLVAGLSGQTHPDLIAIADHALDIHGEGHRRSGELDEPYGIPFRCLIPKGWKNWLVVGRCASFSHIAASSCRLSRTMMDLGHAAGLAAALAKASHRPVAEVDPAILRQTLRQQGTQLDWPPKNLCHKNH